ncbi:hypothetical protein Q6D67_21685 [Haliea sp. E1-2-M8]|uniref:IS66 family insertion sequence element accessory protein TnpA n=1 Tax=Haliea sp. E1-2-M8 TaxID=3064706 RepID=UPI0027234C9D|nr:hypothetical protein [Haliea sp. E1-2-M8]MDO8864283.1 hypothetical protein [Haliea sp. E1-2-M8]
MSEVSPPSVSSDAAAYDTPTALTERQQFWLEHLRACAKANQTTKDYAQAHGLSVKAMYTARKDLAQRGTPKRSITAPFARVQVAPSPPTTQWSVQLPNGTTVNFSGAVDGQSLSAVLNAAASLS